MTRDRCAWAFGTNVLMPFHVKRPMTAQPTILASSSDPHWPKQHRMFYIEFLSASSKNKFQMHSALDVEVFRQPQSSSLVVSLPSLKHWCHSKSCLWDNVFYHTHASTFCKSILFPKQTQSLILILCSKTSISFNTLLLNALAFKIHCHRELLTTWFGKYDF